MRFLANVFVFLLIVSSALALGDPSALQNPQSGMTDSVNTLNQLDPEEEEDFSATKENPQDTQEKLYEDDLQREQQDWEESRTIEDYRYDVPE